MLPITSAPESAMSDAHLQSNLFPVAPGDSGANHGCDKQGSPKENTWQRPRDFVLKTGMWVVEELPGPQCLLWPCPVVPPLPGPAEPHLERKAWCCRMVSSS